MRSNRTYFFILMMLVVISFAIGIIGNIAVNQIPGTLQPCLRFAWPVLVFLLVITLCLTYLQYRLGNKQLHTEDTLQKVADSKQIIPLSVKPVRKAYEFDVFISNSSEDAAWVTNELIPHLEAVGSKIYDIRDFSGLSKINVLEQSTNKCRRVLIVISRSYFEDEWGQLVNQLFQFIDPTSLKRRIIPIIVEKCELPPRLNQIIPIDLTDHQDRDRNWMRLLSIVREPLDDESVPKQDDSSVSEHQEEIEISDPPTKQKMISIIDLLRPLVEDDNAL